MVVLVDGIAEDLGSWSEGCACHEEALKDSASAHRRASKMRKLWIFAKSQVGGSGCRMAGKRSWELACGKIHDFCRDLVENCLASLMVEFSGADALLTGRAVSLMRHRPS